MTPNSIFSACNQVLTLTEHLLGFFYSPLAFVFVLSISAFSPTLTLIFAPEWEECTPQDSLCMAKRGEWRDGKIINYCN